MLHRENRGGPFMNRLLILLLTVIFSVGVGASEFSWQTDHTDTSLVVKLVVKPGGSVYSESIIFNITDANGNKLVPDIAPEKLEAYGEGKWIWRFKGEAPFDGEVEYQGCGKNSEGDEICYPPAKIKFHSYRMGAKKSDVDKTANIPQFKVVKSTSGYMDKDKFLAFLGKETSGATIATSILSMEVMFIIALLGGIALNLTPCILPMIPINLAIIGASGSGYKKGFLRGLCYGSGMAFAYGILGVTVILSGAPFGSLNSSYLFNFIIAGVFIFLAVAMAGFVNFDLSRFRRFDVSKLGKTREVTAFLMGGVSALLAGACVAPVVVSVLLFATSSYNAGYTPALFLPFVLGIGMALPWPFAGAGLAVLPRPNGKVMNIVKTTFAVIILATGIYYIYTGWQLLPGKSSTEAEFIKLEKALTESRKSGKAVLIDFWAPWCKNCIAMENNVLNIPEVKNQTAQYIFVKFNAQDIRDKRVQKLLEYCKVPGLPGYVVAEPAESR